MPTLQQARAFESSGLQRFQVVIATYYDTVGRLGDNAVGRLIADRIVRQDAARVLRSLHTEAAVLGTGGNLSVEARSLLNDIVRQDMQYLDGFMNALPTLSREQAVARCNAYMATVRSTMNELAVLELPKLPVYPQSKYQLDCGQWCHCTLNVVRLVGFGNWDVTWVVDPSAEHCQSCRKLGREWQPLRIRGGVVLRRAA